MVEARREEISIFAPRVTPTEAILLSPHLDRKNAETLAW
jgi:hypothetical protein